MVNNKIYIGIDPSFTNTGIVVIDGDEVYDYEVKLPMVMGDNKGETGRILKRYPLITDALGDIAAIVGELDAIIGIEIPMGRHMGAAAKLDRAYTMCIFAVDEIARQHWAVHHFVTYTPGQLKKFATGKGNAKKDQMRLAAYKKFGFEHNSHDVVDAYFGAMLVKHLDEGKYEL